MTKEVKMTEAEMQELINANLCIVPKNQRKKFDAMTMEQQAAKIKFYQDITRMRAEAREKNSIKNRVAELFDKRHATVNDAKQVMEFAKEFINNFRAREIARLDEQIRQLEMKKQSL